MRILSGACLIFLAANSFAQIENLELPAEHKDKETDQGWKFELDLAGTESWTTNHNVPEVISGYYASLGFKIAGLAELHNAPHEWRNRLTFVETYAKTPPIEQFLKAADRLTLQSEYLYMLHELGGIFLRAHLEAPLFSGEDVRAKEMTYEIQTSSGSKSTIKADHLDLTSAFLPLKLKQAAGLFARLHNDKQLRWEIKAGVMARETIAAEQKFVEQKQGNTIRIKTLPDFYQVGPTAAMSLQGELMEKRFKYRTEFEAFYTAYRYSTVPLGSAFVDRLIYEANAEIELKITEWIWISWDEKISMQPEVSKDLQVTSQLFMHLKYIF